MHHFQETFSDRFHVSFVSDGLSTASDSIWHLGPSSHSWFPTSSPIFPDIFHHQLIACLISPFSIRPLSWVSGTQPCSSAIHQFEVVMNVLCLCAPSIASAEQLHLTQTYWCSLCLPPLFCLLFSCWWGIFYGLFSLSWRYLPSSCPSFSNHYNDYNNNNNYNYTYMNKYTSFYVHLLR